MRNAKGKEMSAKGMAKSKANPKAEKGMNKTMGYAKGGMVKANCGASMPPAQKRGKK